MRRRSVPARFPARLPELFCHHRGLRAGQVEKGYWLRVGQRVVPAFERAHPQTRRRPRARRNRRGVVSSDSRIFSAAAREETVGRPSSLARPTHAREVVLPTTTTAPLAGARVAAPGRDALPPASRRATVVSRTELRASDRHPLSLTPTQVPRYGREEDKRGERLASSALERRTHRRLRVFFLK